MHRQLAVAVGKPRRVPGERIGGDDVASEAELLACGALAVLQKPFPLLSIKPIPNSYAQLAHFLEATNAGRQFRAEQAGVDAFIRYSSDSLRDAS